MKLTNTVTLPSAFALSAAALIGLASMEDKLHFEHDRHDRYTDVIDADTIQDLDTLAQLKAETVDLEMKELADFLNLDAFPQQDWGNMSLDEIKEQFDLVEQLTADWTNENVALKHPYEGKGINYLRKWMDIIKTDIIRLLDRYRALSEESGLALDKPTALPG